MARGQVEAIRDLLMAFAPPVESDSHAHIEKPDMRNWDACVKVPLVLETDPRWLSVQRLINTESFAKASRLSSFLLYIAERFLQGRTEEITEQQIGVYVFGRPTDYNPGDDNIVRQTARQLRQRLALYYQEEGRNELIHIVVPRGGYIPQFQYTGELAISPEVEAEAPVETSSVEDSADLRESVSPAGLIAKEQHWQIGKSVAFVVFGLLLGVAITLLAGFGKARSLHTATETDKLWSVLFPRNQRTIVVSGDAGINMYGNLAKTQVGISEYSSGSYLSKPDAQVPPGFTWAPFAARRYTTLTDLKFVTTLLQLPSIDRSRMEVKFARDITFQDLKDSNAILIGSPNYDPWIQIFDTNQNFKMVYDGAANTISVINRKPLKGEQASYTWDDKEPQRPGYAIISLTDNLESTGKVLLIEGTGMGGVDAASDFLFSSSQMDPVIRDAMGKNGKPSNFELLLETTMYYGGSMKAKVIAERVHQPE
jgi:hypothetical protein